MRTKKKETYRNADDIDIAIRMAQVAWNRARCEMISAKFEADKEREIVNAIGKENLSEQLRARYHTHHRKMREQRTIEATKAEAMYRLELKLNRLKAISGVVKTETFSFVEDKAVTV